MSTLEIDAQKLASWLRQRHAAVRIVTTEEHDALTVARGAGDTLRLDRWCWSSVQGLRGDVLENSPAEPHTENPAAALAHAATKLPERAMLITLDLAPHLDEPRTLRALRETVESFRARGSRLVMIDHAAHGPDVLATFTTRLDLSPPDDAELEALLKRVLRGAGRGEAGRGAKLDVQITRGQFDALLRTLRGLSRRQAESVIADAISDGTLDAEDLPRVIASKRALLRGAGVLEPVDAPASMDQIGGLSALKAWLGARAGAFSDKAEAFGLVPPRGVMLLGVQGAGKSLACKAIAAAWNRPLLRLDPGALYDRYVGESERRLREALRQAEAMAPAVLWIDEIEKAFASAASRSTDGGLSQRMFGALLTWMQEHREPVFLVATANDIEALPPELLRKGRFDEIFFVDLPTPEAREAIFAIHLKKRKRDPGAFDLARLARASEGYSGAEIEQGVLAALHEAFAKGRDVTTDSLENALRASPPLSVTMSEKIEALRAWARGRCVPAD
ncbi:MAG: AAA family ATPase [Planctomycetota bacterium]|nr:AAA family ATPase [Planctomycetota bacterium]